MNLFATNGNAWESSNGALTAYNLGGADGAFSGTPGVASDAAAILTGATGAQSYSATFDLSSFTTAPDRIGDYDYLALGFTRKLGGTAPAVTISNVKLIGIYSEPPAFTVDPVDTADAVEGIPYSSTLANDASDPEGDPMSFSKVSGAAWLSIASDGSLSGTPGSGDFGLNTFTVQVDAAGGSDTATLNITVLDQTGFDINEAENAVRFDSTLSSFSAGYTGSVTWS